MANTIFDTPQEAENAFYKALEQNDLDAMMAIWEDSDVIVCIHPLGPRHQGRFSVEQSWRKIFSSGMVLQFQVDLVQQISSADLVVHQVTEIITVMGSAKESEQPIWATNIYRRSGRSWHMTTHHASPGPRPASHTQLQPSSERLH